MSESRVRENRMPGLTGGRWRSGSHGEPERCARRETGGTEPDHLPRADPPAAYLTRTRAWLPRRGTCVRTPHTCANLRARPLSRAFLTAAADLGTGALRLRLRLRLALHDLPRPL